MYAHTWGFRLAHFASPESTTHKMKKMKKTTLVRYLISHSFCLIMPFFPNSTQCREGVGMELNTPCASSH